MKYCRGKSVREIFRMVYREPETKWLNAWNDPRQVFLSLAVELGENTQYTSVNHEQTAVMKAAEERWWST